MKKLLLLVLAIAFANIITAQTHTLTEMANMPIINDTTRYYLVDSGSVSMAGVNNTSGSNVIWDYSALTLMSNSVITTAYNSTTAVSGASAYPTCNIVEGTSNFYKNTSGAGAQSELVGTALSGFALNFTNTAITAKFPFTAGNSFVDPFSGTVTFTSNGTFTGTNTVSADGTGTLILPGGQQFTGILRVKSRQNSTISGVFPFPITVKLTTYDYYHASQKYPVYSVSYNSIAIFSPTVTASITSNKASTVVGLKDYDQLNNFIEIYPNPSADVVYINTLNTSIVSKSASVYNQLGQLVKTNSLSNNEIEIKDLNKGVYVLVVKTNKGFVQKRIVKQ